VHAVAAASDWQGPKGLTTAVGVAPDITNLDTEGVVASAIADDGQFAAQDATHCE